MIGEEGWSIQMYQIGVDIGGTFTDCGLIGTDGRGTGAYASAKALSTKDDPVDGVMAGLVSLSPSPSAVSPVANGPCILLYPFREPEFRDRRKPTKWYVKAS
jgi:hypothetical protein